ncbi:MAG: hypothetical protein E7508_00845 [Ruminococcus sp.]|nr:hypothetical protein [Ruminococcus sp.]
MDIIYRPFEYVEINGGTSFEIQTVNLPVDMITYLNGTPEIVIVGDANGDGAVTVSDCAQIARDLAKKG